MKITRMTISCSFHLFHQPYQSNYYFKLIKLSSLSSLRNISSYSNKNHKNNYFFDQELSQLHQINSHTFSTHLSNQWSITNIPNGGFLSSLAIKASRKVIQNGNIISLSSHFYNRTIENCPTEILVETLNSTKSSTTVLTTISQENIKRCSFFLTFSFKKSNKFTLINDCPPPNLPSINECSSASEKLRIFAGNNLRIAERVDFWTCKKSNFINNLIKLSHENVVGNVVENNKAELNCWLKFSDERPITLTSLAFLNDCLPPPILSLLGMRNTWVPTVEYSVQFWGVPTTESIFNNNKEHNEHYNNDSHECLLVGQGNDCWVQAQFVTNHVENGMLSTDSQIWSSDGKTLLANSRQLAKLVTI